MGYLIAIEGINALIDRPAVARIGDAQERTVHLFGHNEQQRMLAFVKAYPDDYWLLGFSAGASASVIRPLITELDVNGYALPTHIITVGLFGWNTNENSPRYENTGISIQNYLDDSGQWHDGQPQCVNLVKTLGRSVPHLDPKLGGMAWLADSIEKGAVS